MADQDSETIRRILAGEQRAYAELVDRHKDRAMTLAMRLLKNREDAEEALQDAFVRTFHALPRFEWKSSFSTWFYRIVYNVCATRLSRRGEEVFTTTDEQEHEGEWSLELASPDEAPEVAAENLQFQQIVHEQIEKLPVLYGSILTLFLVQDMSYDEIVEVTGLPLGTVKARLFRARDMLRRGVARRMQDDPRKKPTRKVAAKL